MRDAVFEHFIAFTVIAVVSWEGRGTVEEEGTGTEPQYSKQERKLPRRKILKNNSVEV